MEGAHYLQRLVRRCAETPCIAAAAVAGPAAGDRFAELDLYLTVTGVLPNSVPEWVAPLGETAFAGDGEVITADGLTIRIHTGRTAPAGAQLLFDRGAPPAPAVDEGAPPFPDLAADAALFWRDLFVAAAAIGREQPFTAHGRLERCRQALAGIYRLALQPGRPGAGWEGLEALPGAGTALDGLAQWLVQPLDLRAQWRCAGRLAEAYEKLVLPLAERLKLDYPWAMRNLTFRRLDEIRPDRTDVPAVPRLRDTADEAAPPRREGPARFKVKVRREPE